MLIAFFPYIPTVTGVNRHFRLLVKIIDSLQTSRLQLLKCRMRLCRLLSC
jgi:hypothetical protein